MIALGVKLSPENVIRSNAKNRTVTDEKRYVEGNRLVYISIGSLSIFISILVIFSIVDTEVSLILYVVFWVFNKLAIMILNNIYTVK